MLASGPYWLPGRGYLCHRHPLLADGAPLRRPYRATPGAAARGRGFPAQDRAATGLRPGGEPPAGGGATRGRPGDGGLPVTGRHQGEEGRGGRAPEDPPRWAPAERYARRKPFAKRRRAEDQDKVPERSGVAEQGNEAPLLGVQVPHPDDDVPSRGLEQVPRQVLPEVLRQVPGALRRLRAARRAPPRHARRGRRERHARLRESGRTSCAGPTTP